MVTAYIFYYLMLMPGNAKDKPIFIKRFDNPVDCEIRKIELKDVEPKSSYSCLMIKSHLNLADDRIKKVS